MMCLVASWISSLSALLEEPFDHNNKTEENIDDNELLIDEREGESE